MLRKLLILAFLISLLTQWKFSWGENYDFRNTKWGMPLEEVLASEININPFEKNENIIRYKTQILGKNVELLYLFANNKLIGSAYKLDDNYINSRHFINTYKEFKVSLIKKYGQPKKETTNWLDDTYRGVRSKWGLAVSLGHLEYSALWETPNTKISSSLKEENHNILCFIEYKSIEHSNLSDGIKKGDKPDPF